MCARNLKFEIEQKNDFRNSSNYSKGKHIEILEVIILLKFLCNWSVNSKVVGRDSGVVFSLRNFLDDILQPTNVKNVTNVKFRSFALFLNSKFCHKLYSFLKIT